MDHAEVSAPAGVEKVTPPVEMTLLEAAERTLSIAESWIHDQLDGTSLLEAELARLGPARAAIAKARTIPPGT